MAMFIRVDIAPSVQQDPALCAKLVEVCPVDIFQREGEGVTTVEENLDECTLCDLCIAEQRAGGGREPSGT
jgi:NAD-dependent dihydropyrimidine dehydrogenase PreA subunit